MGETVTLSYFANSGYQFKQWQLISGNVSLSGNSFTMPNEAVTVKALFESTSSNGNNSSSSSNTSSSSSSSSSPSSNSSNTSSSDTSTSISTPNYSSESRYDGYNDAYGNQGTSPSSKFSYRTLVDSKTGISVAGLFTSSTKLMVTPLNETGSIVSYDISIDGEYSGIIEISIPVDAKYNGKDVYIVHKAKDKTENIKATVENGYVKFKVSSFSPFIVKESLPDGEKLTNNQTKGDFYNPKTGGGFPVEKSKALVMFLPLISTLLISLVLWKRYKKLGNSIK